MEDDHIISVIPGNAPAGDLALPPGDQTAISPPKNLIKEATSLAYHFAGFTFLPAQGALLFAEQPVKVGSRALAILALFLERNGQTVSHKDLFDHVWPGTFVEQNNLRVHLTALRKVLGKTAEGGPFIINVPGRGYRFIAAVDRLARDVQGASAAALSNLPAPLTSLIGRGAALDMFGRQLVGNRLVTIVGPGGIGKSRFALASVARFTKDGSCSACFVELASVADPRLVPSAIALALQLPTTGDDALADLVRRLHSRNLILILDNCEHLIDVVAAVAEAVLLACAGVKIVATSREALRLGGETLFHLAPLEVPADTILLTAERALGSPAVQLFVERATAASDTFSLSDENAATVSSICQGLDGLPLAIELAAGSTASLGLSELARGLNAQLPILGQGSRTRDRHRTIRATLDWSYALLNDDEREALAMLSVFRGAFTLDAAAAVVAEPGSGSQSAIGPTMGLIAKSLISADLSGSASHFRLLETTRVYASEKLSLNGLGPVAHRRHAAYLAQSLDLAASEWLTRQRAEWWEMYGRRLDDVRAALDWALADGGDQRLGILLTVASIPLWIGLSKLAEFRARLETALDRTESAGLADTDHEIRLHLTLYSILFNTEGPTQGAILSLHRVLEIAPPLGDGQSELTALWALAGYRHVAGDYAIMLSLARQVAKKADAFGDRESIATAQRFLALAHLRTGDPRTACDIGERLIVKDRSERLRFAIAHHDQGSAVRGNLAVALWLRGFADQAQDMMIDALDRAERARNPPSLCYILSHMACPLALWVGDTATAQRLVGRLIEESDENGFVWKRWWAWMYECVIAARLDPLSPRHVELKAGIPDFRGLERDTVITLDSKLMDSGSVHRAFQLDGGWCSAELLRAAGERSLDRRGGAGASAAKALFFQAMDLAREQGALAWELRAAHSLAELKSKAGSRAAGIEILEPVLSRFSEGHGTADFRSAKVWLDG